MGTPCSPYLKGDEVCGEWRFPMNIGGWQKSRFRKKGMPRFINVLSIQLHSCILTISQTYLRGSLI